MVFLVEAVAVDVNSAVRRRALLMAVLSWAAAAGTAHGHNLALAVAVPVEGIVIDGDLGEWPNQAARCPVSLGYGAASLEESDYQGSFMVGYNGSENALYIAVEMVDESIVVGAAGDWDDYDGCEVYVDPSHDPGNVTVGQYALRGIDVQVVEPASRDEVEVAVRRDGGVHRYEWRIDVGARTRGATRVAGGLSLGFDIALCDRDADGSFSFMTWGPGGAKYVESRNRGDLVLLPPGGETGVLEGSLTWDDGVPAAHTGMAVQGLARQTRLRALTDAEGRFRFALPAGRYDLRPDVRIGEGFDTRVEVAPGATVQRAFALDRLRDRAGEEKPLGDGVVVPAGPGRRQRAGPGHREGSFHNIGVSDGLPDASVVDIFRDSRGYLWFATTAGGVSRYDGQQFLTFTAEDGLCDNSLSAIAEDTEGSLWFACGGFFWGLEGGVSRYDGASFMTWGKPQGLAGANVAALEVDRSGAVWIAAGNAQPGWGSSPPVLQRLLDGRITTFDLELPGAVSSILEDREGGLWVGSEGRVSRYDGRRFIHFPISGSVHALMQDRMGRIWAGTSNGQVARLEGGSFSVVASQGVELPAVTGVSPAVNGVFNLLEDNTGAVWIATGSGVGRYDGGGFQGFTEAQGLASWNAHAIAQDREGNIWFGTGGYGAAGNGASRYAADRLQRFAPRDGLTSNNLMSLGQDRQGNLWLGTWDGVKRYDGSRFTDFEKVPYNTYQIVEDDEGYLWFGGPFGVRRCRGDTCQPFLLRTVFALFSGSDGRVWLGGDETLAVFDHGSMTNLATPPTRVQSLAVDATGGLWLGTDEGVRRLEGDQLVAPAWAEAVPEANVNALFADRRDHLWIGLWGGGLARWDGESVTRYTADAGLSHQRVIDIREDRRGRLWLSTFGGGVSQFDGLVFQTLVEADGLPHDAVQQTLEDRDGSIWIATEGGLARYRPGEVPPLVRVVGVTTDQDLGPRSSVRLPSSQGYLAFDFHGSSFRTRPGQLAYVYRLVGYQETWQVTREERVAFHDLPRGDYTFEVHAVDVDLNYSEPARVAVAVDLPYERIAWGSGLALALVLVAWQTARVVRRDQRLTVQNLRLHEANADLARARDAAEAANRAKSQFLANISHEIRTPMNAILGYAQLLKRGGDRERLLPRAVETIQASGEHLLHLINDVLDLSKIEAGRMELHPVEFDLRSLLETLSVMFGVRCRQKGLAFRLEGLGGPVWVRGDESKLSQVLMNLLGNAVKFTDRGEVVLGVERAAGEGYRFAVVDTGVGIPVAQRERLFEAFEQGPGAELQGGAGLGLAIARRLVRLMGGELEVASQVGAGSRFWFEVELPAVARQVAPLEVREDRWSQVERLAAGYSVRALVADDVVANREVLRGVLEAIGAQVVEAEDGRVALERLVEFAADIVFLDVRMPVLDGVAALRRLREGATHDSVKAVAVSASTLDHERQAVLDAGFDAFLGKPFRFGEVCRCLAQLLGVEFEYRPTEAAAQDGTSPQLTALRVPPELVSRMRRAARLYSVTELESYLEELNGLGAEARDLADHLRRLRQQHDIEGIDRVLQQVEEASR